MARPALPVFLRIALVLIALIALILTANYGVQYITMALSLDATPTGEAMIRKFILVSTALYVVLIAIPFVPGAEIGMTLLSLFGVKVAAIVYFATVAGLSVAYSAGRMIVPTVLVTILAKLGLRRAAAFARQQEDLSEKEWLEALVSRTDKRLIPFLLRNRYVALALLINLPGSALIGGGGGIAMAAGLSRLFAPLPFLLTILIAVLPVPLAVVLLGT
ncbi:MAG: hypothetical protein HKP40_02875 [Litoreibacter sp.]|nr:hypothetical protein [Litoreibacter sp.]